MACKYAEVIISISHKEVDRAFTYRVSEENIPKAVTGMRVIVPFGQGNKRQEGYIINIIEDENSIEFDRSKIKDIISFPDAVPMFDGKMLELAQWMKEKYYTTLSQCLKCIMPSGVRLKNNYIYSALDYKGYLTKGQKELYAYIEDLNKPVTLRDLSDVFGDNAANTLEKMVKSGALLKEQITENKDYVQKIRFVCLNRDTDIAGGEELNGILSKNNKQSAVIEILKERGEIALSDLKNMLGITDSPIKTLEKKGFVQIHEVETRRHTVDINKYEDMAVPELNTEQYGAVNRVSAAMDLEDNRPVLIHGVTGSGKTEIYLRLIEKVIAQGKQAIVLVPEISLTPQTVERFTSRFKEKVTVTHSRLSNGERYDQWKNAREGRISVMIGPRSAVFTPFNNLGIIVIDEEHETTYKSETTPKFDAREVAIMRAEQSGAIVVMGSATPSLESYYKAKEGDYHLITLKNRVNSQFPHVTVVDMREELEKGNKSIFSEELFAAMKENIQQGKQTILFLNRRGHSTFVSCRKCGHVLKCEDCNINYTYHIYSNRLMCHYCGKQASNPKNCPQCGSKYIKYFGVGTQKIEDEVRCLFPDVSVLRMDMDTTAKKNSHEEILDKFKSGEGQILIGTQMIAKGLDFPNVTLVGVVAADISLNAGDYKSGETTFQLLTQVSGRAGRAGYSGKVYIQTYNPDHYALKFSKDNDYEEFYEHEIALRRQMDYPPYTHIFTALFTGENEKKIITALFKLSEIMAYYNKSGDFEVLGPAPAFVSKIRKRYRWKLIVKCSDELRLKNFMLYCVDKLKNVEDVSDININLTLNPGVSV